MDDTTMSFIIMQSVNSNDILYDNFLQCISGNFHEK